MTIDRMQIIENRQDAADERFEIILKELGDAKKERADAKKERAELKQMIHLLLENAGIRIQPTSPPTEEDGA